MGRTREGHYYYEEGPLVGIIFKPVDGKWVWVEDGVSHGSFDTLAQVAVAAFKAKKQETGSDGSDSTRR